MLEARLKDNIVVAILKLNTSSKISDCTWVEPQTYNTMNEAEEHNIFNYDHILF